MGGGPPLVLKQESLLTKASARLAELHAKKGRAAEFRTQAERDKYLADGQGPSGTVWTLGPSVATAQSDCRSTTRVVVSCIAPSCKHTKDQQFISVLA